MQGKTKEKYVDVVPENGYLNVVFLPTGKVLAQMLSSRRAGMSANLRLIGAVIEAYEVYLQEVYGL